MNVGAKLYKIEEEISALNKRVKDLETEYNILTDQYIEGLIPHPIGKEQKKLQKQIDSCKKRVLKLGKEYKKLVKKYGNN